MDCWILLGYEGSNLDSESQILVCCHCTIAQSAGLSRLSEPFTLPVRWSQASVPLCHRRNRFGGKPLRHRRPTRALLQSLKGVEESEGIEPPTAGLPQLLSCPGAAPALSTKLTPRKKRRLHLPHTHALHVGLRCGQRPELRTVTAGSTVKINMSHTLEASHLFPCVFRWERLRAKAQGKLNM